MSLSLETLNAFLDGELDPRERDRVERTLAGDPHSQRVVDQLRRGSDLLQSAYGEALNGPLPQRVVQLLEPVSDAAALEPPDLAPPISWRWLPIALAAGLAALLVAAPASYFLAQYHVERMLADQAALIRADHEISQSARNQALENHVSGETVSWVNPDSGSSGRATPLRTFKTSQGQWCREYLQRADLVTESALRRAVACREPDGNWRDRLEILSES